MNQLILKRDRIFTSNGHRPHQRGYVFSFPWTSVHTWMPLSKRFASGQLMPSQTRSGHSFWDPLYQSSTLERRDSVFQLHLHLHTQSTIQQVTRFRRDAVKCVMSGVTDLNSVILLILLLKAWNCHQHLPYMQYDLITRLFWMLSFTMPRGRFSPGKHLLLV